MYLKLSPTIMIDTSEYSMVLFNLLIKKTVNVLLYILSGVHS